jgi:hypothetical protein
VGVRAVLSVHFGMNLQFWIFRVKNELSEILAYFQSDDKQYSFATLVLLDNSNCRRDPICYLHCLLSIMHASRHVRFFQNRLLHNSNNLVILTLSQKRIRSFNYLVDKIRINSISMRCRYLEFRLFYCTANINIVIAKIKRGIASAKVHFSNIREVIFAEKLVSYLSIALIGNQKVCKFYTGEQSCKNDANDRVKV